ncbi:MAG: hypothetical protein QOH29_1652 [Actinomycetota bacterium]|nr:hypothetical protein [Actinomycetota bacterium]
MVTSTVRAVAAASVTPRGVSRRGPAGGLSSGGPLSARFVTYLQFRVPRPEGTVVKASLRLAVESTTKSGFLVVGTALTGGVRFVVTATRVPPLASALGSSGPTVKGTSVTVPLRGLSASAGGRTTLALQSASGAIVDFRGISGRTPPRLTVTRRVGAATAPAPQPARPPVHIAAAGDIACDASKPAPSGRGVVPGIACGQRRTSDLLLGLHPAAVLPLGDTQYSNGALAKYAASYGPTWGRLLDISHPTTGNHEYMNSQESSAGAGYFAYFGAAAGAVNTGWYSFDLGGWHLISLNAQCAAVGGCQAGSPQERWLAADLAAHPNQCTLAYWHQPRFSSGQHGDEAAYGAFWNDLYRAGADLVLNGHDHDYERFAPQTPAAKTDPARGIREFIVGTGGEDQRPFKAVQPNSVVRENHTFGVLELTLGGGSYTWRFLPVPSSTFTDTGSGTCHNTPGH